VRRGSDTFGQWHGAHLTAENRCQFYIPPGFAHGFVVLSEVADFVYKCTEVYHPEDEAGVRWDDPQIAIDWPRAGEPILSARDAALPTLSELDAEVLPVA